MGVGFNDLVNETHSEVVERVRRQTERSATDINLILGVAGFDVLHNAVKDKAFDESAAPSGDDIKALQDRAEAAEQDMVSWQEQAKAADKRIADIEQALKVESIKLDEAEQRIKALTEKKPENKAS